MLLRSFLLELKGEATFLEAPFPSKKVLQISRVASIQEAAQFLPKGCSRKMPPSFLNLNGAVCSNTLFSNTSALTSSLLFRGNSTYKVLEHLVWSNTSGFQFWRPLARTNFLSALCGLPKHRATTLGKSHGHLQNLRRDPRQRPLRTPLRGKLPRRASRRVVPRGW